MKKYTPLEGATGVEKVEELKKAITTTLQSTDQTVYSPSRILAGLIKDYTPAFNSMDNENFPGINYVLKRFTGGTDPFVEANVGSQTDAGTAISNVGLKGTMVRGKKVIDIDDEVYRDQFDGLSKQQKEAEILNYVARIVSKEKLKQAWLGDTGSGSYTLFNGFAKLINDTTGIVKPVTTGITTMRALLRQGVRNIPEDYDLDEYMFFMTKNAYETLKEEYGAGDNTLSIMMEMDGRRVQFDNKNIQVIPGLLDTKVYLARKEDLVVIDGTLSINIIDRVALEEIYKVIMRWWMHANLRNPLAIVELTHTVDVEG